MIFDWTITLGNVLTIIGVMGGGMFALVAMRSDIRLLSFRVGEAEKDLDKIATAIVETARQSMWLKSLDGQIIDIQRRLMSLEDARDKERR